MISNKKTILWVEDDEYLYRYLRDFLVDSGYNIIPAHDADAAFELIDRGRYDLLITDLMMPTGRSLDQIETHGGMRTGLYIARASYRAFPEVPIIIHTMRIPDFALHDAIKTISAIYINKLDNNKKLFTFIERSLFEKSKRHDMPGRLYEALKLEPSFMGVGVDIKKILKILRGG